VVSIDFESPELNYRRKFGGGKNQAIAKACGLSKGYRKIIDATAGLGEDSFILAALGAEVLLIERHPELFKALNAAMDRARENPELREIIGRMTLLEGDSKRLIPRLPSPEVILLDPMFPPREKSALVKKPLRLLKELVGEDLDSDELLPIALLHATRRVVVKRPKPAGFLNQQKPDFQIVGKSSRFDGYGAGKASI